MKAITFISGVLLMGSLYGQVCCSLVGAVDNGGGTSSTHWDTHWPSRFDTGNPFRWVAGLNTIQSDSRDLNVQYGLTATGFIQLSLRLGATRVSYLHLESSLVQLRESLSFGGSSATVYQTGLRELLPGRLGYLNAEVMIPANPQYTNPDFAFKNGAVPSFFLAWINRFQSPWKPNSLILPGVNTITVSFNQNLAQKADVFIDQELRIHFSSSLNPLRVFRLSPFVGGKMSKLLAPPSPWEDERQSRWLGVIWTGMDLTLSDLKWEWLHLRISFPVYARASQIGFPDGTEPTSKLLLALTFNGSLGAKGESGPRRP